MKKRSTTTITLHVRMVLPEDANAQMAQEYVRSAINCHSGSLDPEDPMFNLTGDVVVRLVKKEIVYV